MTSSNVTASGVDLAWDSVSSASGYNVYQDGVVIDSSATATYSVSGLSSATEYEFYVTAVDDADTDADNESLPSNTVTITTS